MIKKLSFLTLLFSNLMLGQYAINSNENAPPISITDWILNTPADKNLSNKFIVLEFWATWCGPCIEAVPHLNALQEKFNQKDLYFISITDESIAKVNRLANRIDFKSIVVSDTSKKTQIAFGNGVDGLEAFPMTILIDKKGVIKWIGSPIELNETIMKEFLTGILQPYHLFKNNNPIRETAENLENEEEVPSENYDFYLDVFLSKIKDPNLHYTLEIFETKDKNRSSTEINKSSYFFNSIGIKEIFSTLLKYNPNFIEVNDVLSKVNYKLFCKNKNASNEKDLEKSIIELLDLKISMYKKKVVINKFTIVNEKLLEQTLNVNEASISDAGDKILVTAINFEDLMIELNTLELGIFVAENNTDKKLYDFVLDKNSTSALLKSLESYGISFDSKEELIEVIKIEKNQ